MIDQKNKPDALAVKIIPDVDEPKKPNFVSCIKP